MRQALGNTTFEMGCQPNGHFSPLHRSLKINTPAGRTNSVLLKSMITVAIARAVAHQGTGLMKKAEPPKKNGQTEASANLFLCRSCGRARSRTESRRSHRSRDRHRKNKKLHCNQVEKEMNSPQGMSFLSTDTFR